MSGPVYPEGNPGNPDNQGTPSQASNPSNQGNPSNPQNPSGQPAYPPYPGYPPAPVAGYPTYPQQPQPAQAPQPQPQPQQPPTGYPGYPAYPGYPQTGYPPAGYPPYPQAAYPPYPGYPPVGYPQPMYQPPQRSGSSRGLWITLSVIGGVLIIACIVGTVFIARGIGSAVGTIGSSAGADLTMQEFCNELEIQDYASAYQHLSSNLQQSYTQEQFTQDNTNFDTTLGQVTTCDTSGTPTINGSQVSITLNIERTPATPTPDSTGNIGTTSPSDESGQVTLIQESGQWVIDSVDSTLSVL